jgi:hypothetical protein
MQAQSRIAGTHCHPSLGANDKCPIVGVLPIAEYPHQQPFPGAPKLTDGWGCSAIGLGVANYAGMEKTYLVGDRCSGRVWGIAWDKGAGKWQMQELMQASLQFTSGTVDENGYVLATNCYCFYTDDKGPTQNPPGAAWRLLPASEVKTGMEVAKVKLN